MSDINVIMEDEQPITVIMEDDQPIEVTIGGVGLSDGFTINDILSNPPSGCYRIVNIYLNASLEIVIVYDNVAET